MAKRLWDLRSASRVLGLNKTETDKKLIHLSDHRLTLGTGGALDYLKKEHNFRVV